MSLEAKGLAILCHGCEKKITHRNKTWPHDSTISDPKVLRLGKPLKTWKAGRFSAV